jgi:hypothetical protein
MHGSFTFGRKQFLHIRDSGFHRNVIRSAMKKGIKIRSGTEKRDLVHRLIRNSFERSANGFYVPKMVLKRLQERLGGQSISVSVALVVSEHIPRLWGLLTVVLRQMACERVSPLSLLHNLRVRANLLSNNNKLQRPSVLRKDCTEPN